MTSVQDGASPSVEDEARLLYRGVLCGPMVRASTTPLRALALEYGADAVYSEELVDRAITQTVRQVRTRTVDYAKDHTGRSSKKLLKKLQSQPPALILRIDRRLEAGKLICQLGTGEPELAVAAARHVAADVAAIDVNMGCPKKFSISGGMGSALLSDPGRAAKILRALREAIPNKPVSCKIRLLGDVEKTLEFCDRMVEAGALAIAIHGRRVGMKEQDPADWESLRKVVVGLKQKYPRLPVLVNGDFYTRQEFQDFMKETGADGVLLARPALYNTSVFRRPSPTTTSMSLGYDSPLLLDKTAIIQRYLQLCRKYNTHYKNAKYVLCEMMNNRRAPAERSLRLSQNYPGGQTIAKVCNSKSLEALLELFQVPTTTNEDESNDEEKKQEGEPQGEAPAAGEHRYEDSYFLRHEKRKAEEPAQSVVTRQPDNNTTTVTPTTVTAAQEEPANKKPKT